MISGKLFTQRWMLVEITGANKMYTTKRYKRVHSDLILKVLSACLARAKIFENVGFFSRDAKIGKFSYIHVLNTIELRTLYTHLYFFVVYILFVLVISTSINS